MNNIFTNRIGAFYPVSESETPTFYFEFDQLPVSAQVNMSISLLAIEPTSLYRLHLEIYKDNYKENNKLVDSYITSDPTNTIFGENSRIDSSGLNSTNLIWTSPSFQVEGGIHTYVVHLDLLDNLGQKLDSSETWFLTRLKSKNNQFKGITALTQSGLRKARTIS